jgi:hypothetical protein
MSRAGRKRKLDVPRYPNGRIKNAFRGDAKRIAVRRPCSLYVMSNYAIGCIKIGVSVAPANRAAVINTATPGGASLSAVWPLGRELAYALERECHRRLRGTRHHISGEWYRLSAESAESFIIKTASDLGLSLERALA